VRGHLLPSPTVFPNVCLRPLLPLQVPILTADTNPVDTSIAGKAAAALLRMYDRGIRHHFPGNPRNGHLHYRGITVVPITV